MLYVYCFCMRAPQIVQLYVFTIAKEKTPMAPTVPNIMSLLRNMQKDGQEWTHDLWTCDSYHPRRFAVCWWDEILFLKIPQLWSCHVCWRKGLMTLQCWQSSEIDRRRTLAKSYFEGDHNITLARYRSLHRCQHVLRTRFLWGI